MTVVVTPLSGSEKLRLREVFSSVQDSGSLSGYIHTYGFVRFSSPCSHREMLISTCFELSLSFGTQHTVVFTFGEVDLVPTVEEYTALLQCPRFQCDKIYSRAACVPTFGKKLMTTHPDEAKRVDIFALSLYGLIVFPRVLEYVDEATTDLFHRLGKRVTSVPTILAETFRSLNACRRASAGKFVDSLLQNLQSKDVEWRAPWMIPGEILCRCGSFDWVPLLGIWGAIGYAPLLVLRQYGLRQFIPTTYRLVQSEFVYSGADYKRKVSEISSAWNKTCRFKRE
ncbi:hypothetical protein CXB51_014959 [Gossypium anomalum]|uniref:DUF7745 domain-containing protein n=1 Tax=Gossypium anomalum TaxID=47600 RepID=A0A8J5YY70_9ROSI|nr:hypothetical protein CXB51_014959 [Gossypium anomalum]